MVKIEKVEKIYRNGSNALRVLKGINFNVEKGEFVAIMGPSGSGKSTLMNIIGCLDKATNGRYILDGEDVSNLNEDQLSGVRNNKIGFVFQSFNLLPKLTALDNVCLPMIYSKIHKHDRVERAIKSLESVGLGDRMHHRPNELSGGQKQRVAIARALVNNPRIILADEPTGNLDSKSEAEIMQIFKELNDKGVTIIMVTHEHEIGIQCKRIITLKDGEIVSDLTN